MRINKGVFKQMKGAETAVKWKEAKGHARKLSGKTCKGKFKSSRELTGLNERTGRGAWWPAVSRQRVNPATGRHRAADPSPQGLPSGRDFCSISPQRPRTSPKTSIFRVRLILDNTPSIASIIPDDADDAVHAGDAGEMLSPKSERAT